MNFFKILSLLSSLVFIFFLMTMTTEARTPSRASDHVRWNLSNWTTAPHPKVISFSVDDQGNAKGILEDGTVFRQYNFFRDSNIRVQRFEMEDYYHYVVNENIAHSLQELSILLHNPNQN